MIERTWICAGEKGTTGNYIDISQPDQDKPFARVRQAGPEQVEQAIQAAVRAFDVTRKLSSRQRREILFKVADAIEKDIDRISTELAREAGKPLTLARGEASRAILTFRTAAEEVTHIGGEMLNLDVTEDSEGVLGMVRRFPIGPVAAITPFNFPLNLVAHKLAPAVAAGCPVVLKPASATPLSALNLAHLLIKYGWPKEAISVLTCSAKHAAPLVEDERIKLITFTGSMDVGWSIKSRAGKKRVALELGGNAAAVIDADADLEYAARRIATGGFAYAGQSCISAQRIFVHWNAKKTFLRLLLDEIGRLKMGDCLDPDVLVGPLITRDEAKRVESWVNEARKAGAHVLCGGTRNGAYYTPTVLTQISDDMKVSCQEVFGPVIVVDSFDEWDQALAKVNNSDYGLQAGIFTNDMEKIMQAWEEIEVGGLVVNDMPTYRVDPMPYGGVKDSGTGREGPRYSIEEMTEPRLLLIRRR